MVKIQIAQIAFYIFFAAAAMLLASRVMWLLFFFFCYRFWTAIIPFTEATKKFHVINITDYMIIIALITIATYTLIVFATAHAQYVRYIIFLILTLYVLHKYSLSDIFLFKDILVKHGMWNGHYWTQQLNQLFKMSTSTKQNLFVKIGNNVWNFIGRLFSYAKHI